MSIKEYLTKKSKDAPKVVSTTIDGVVFHIKQMDGNERSEFDYAMSDIATKSSKEQAIKAVRGLALAASLCNEQGVREFQITDADMLNKLPISIVEPLFRRTKELNQLTDSEVEEVKGE